MGTDITNDADTGLPSVGFFFFPLEMCGFKMCHVLLGGMTENLNHSVFIHLFILKLLPGYTV